MHSLAFPLPNKLLFPRPFWLVLMVCVAWLSQIPCVSFSKNLDSVPVSYKICPNFIYNLSQIFSNNLGPNSTPMSIHQKRLIAQKFNRNRIDVPLPTAFLLVTSSCTREKANFYSRLFSLPTAPIFCKTRWGRPIFMIIFCSPHLWTFVFSVGNSCFWMGLV